MLRLSELAEETSVPKETIHYYLRAGILPRPQKVREKLALYNQNHVRLIRLVQQLQREKRMPLSDMARLFRESDYDAEKLEINLIAGKYEAPESEPAFLPGLSVPEEDLFHLDLDGAFLERLRALGLIGSGDGESGAEDRRLAAMLRVAEEKGIRAEFFGRIREPLEQIAKCQTEMMFGAVGEDAGYAEIVREAGEVDRLVNRYLEAAKTRLLRQRLERSMAEAPFSVERLLEKIYVPSEAFLARHQIPEQLKKLEAAGDPLALAAALIGIGRYREAAEQAAKGEARDPLESAVLGAIANALLGESDRAVDLAGRALSLAPENPRVAAYSAMAYFVQAARIGGLVSPLGWLQRAMKCFEVALYAKPESLRDRLEVAILTGRGYTILPGALARLDEGIAALQGILELLDAHDESAFGFELAGWSEIYRINTHFYLGEVHQRLGRHEAARKAWNEVLLRDPASNFANYVYNKTQGG